MKTTGKFLPPYFMRINGVIIPTPETCSIDEYDLDSADSGRPESGVLIRDRKRAKLGRYQCKWSDLKAQEAWTLRTMLLPEQFTVEVWMFDQYVARTMYAGDLHWTQRFDSDGIAHIGLQTQFSEV